MPAAAGLRDKTRVEELVESVQFLEQFHVDRQRCACAKSIGSATSAASAVRAGCKTAMPVLWPKATSARVVCVRARVCVGVCVCLSGGGPSQKYWPW
jgi:hypothetical protein